MLLLVIEPLFLTLHEASLICSFQAPQYDYFNNFNVILMETYVSRKIKYIMHNVQSHDVLYNKVVLRATLHTRVDIVLTCGKHLHDHIIYIRGEFLFLNY